MYFGMKNTLKNYHNRIPKQARIFEGGGSQVRDCSRELRIVYNDITFFLEIVTVKISIISQWSITQLHKIHPRLI